MDNKTCPKCNGPLEEGEIGGGHYLIWARKLSPLSGAYSGETIASTPAVTARLNGKRCEKCKMIIIDYSSTSPEIERSKLHVFLLLAVILLMMIISELIGASVLQFAILILIISALLLYFGVQYSMTQK